MIVRVFEDAKILCLSHTLILITIFLARNPEIFKIIATVLLVQDK